MCSIETCPMDLISTVVCLFVCMGEARQGGTYPHALHATHRP